jgi:hypothetical protein
VHGIVGGNADACAKGVAAADLKAIVLYHVELVGECVDRGVA